MDISIIVDAINRFHDIRNKVGTTRHKSWGYCYTFFKENLYDLKNLDLLSLNLSWYLASWGMLRGSFLLNYDYKIHYDVIEKLSAEEFKSFYNESNIFDEELTFKAIDIVKNGYLPHLPSDTLISKILLGIFGCMPAYDTFFKKAVKHYNVSKKQLNINTLNDLWELYNNNKKIFDDLTNKFLSEGIYYPPMKLIDMAFFQLGKEL